MDPLIECVANFSEGRDRGRIEALATAMSSVAGAVVLDLHADPDHNRTVITVAGEPEAVAEAALRGVGRAVELIDLTRQTGVHPRMGAADVVPFVPIEGYSLEDCAALARRTGRRIWERIRVPVYFYGAAASRPERAALESVRRGQFEGLRDAALLLPERAPDLGGPAMHPTAGAVAVGARNFLIACNANLRCNSPAQAPEMSVTQERAQTSVAKKIARAIRSSSGGLPGVKAIGVELLTRGQAQVSMNLTDFSQTSLAQLFDAVRREAARYGCNVAEEEIVGLVPIRALEVSGGMKPPKVRPSQILENRLAESFGQKGHPQAAAAQLPSNESQFQSILMKDR